MFQQSNYALDLSKKPFSQVQVTDAAAISQSMEAIIMTSKGERVFNPNFGSTLSANIFKLMTEKKGEAILDYLIELLRRYEKRITIYDDKCSIDINSDLHILTLNIAYSIKPVSSAQLLFWKRKITF
jgi:phage baseplate assembly protein W